MILSTRSIRMKSLTWALGQGQKVKGPKGQPAVAAIKSHNTCVILRIVFIWCG